MMNLRKSSRSVSVQTLTAGMLVLTASVAGSATGCSSEDDANDPSSPSCVSTREYFTTQVYGKALTTCAGCHTPGGAADQKGAKFKMYRDTYPDFVSANLEGLKDYVKLDYDGKPLFLRKPLGERNHGGGAVLTPESEEFKILQKFTTELRANVEKSCDGNGQLGVDYLDGPETARKAGIVLAGRVPTDEELAKAGTQPGLEELVIGFTKEELFYDHLREIWNDALLTERGLDAGIGATFFNAPQLYDDRYPGYSTDARNWTSISVTEEPMRYIEYVVRNDQPFSDVVAGNYLVANPYTAKLYGVPHDKALSPDNFLAWQRVDFAPIQNYEVDNAPRTAGVPVAGVLTTPAFLNRWETTRTNRGRKRARVVLKNFLATDILKFAQRPVDSTTLTSVQNPTQNSAQCSVCHTVLDPIAGGFRGFDEQNILRFTADDNWHDDMLPPGINAVQMPPSNYGNAIMWLGAQIPRDPRFAISVAQIMFTGLTGDEPLGFPQDKAAADYEDRVRSYSIQNDWFVKVGKDFQASKYDLRKLVVAIVNSAYFRAKNGDANKDALHQGLGQGRILTPEMLGRKYRATTGLYFFANQAASGDQTRSRDNFLRSDLVEDRDWRLVYGGIDSGDVTKRTDSMSPIMLATSQYTAGIVACRATSFDFTKPQGERRLFRSVELDTTPFTIRTKESPTQTPKPDAEPKIKETISKLHFRLLGERVAPDSPEVARTYSLFLDTWKDLEERNFKEPNKDLGMANGRCVADTNWDAKVRFEPDQNGNLNAVFDKLRDRPEKAPYEPGMKLDRDDTFTVRSWQAVMTYLLSDYKFTHE